MIAPIFYFQVFFYFALLGFAIWQRSPAFFLLAGVFSVMTAVQISGDGISFQDGWRGSTSGDIEDLDMNISATYSVQNLATSDSVQAWYYSLMGLGFVWWICAYFLAAQKGTFDFLKSKSGR